WHGLYRTLPVEYSNDLGANYALFVNLLDATDDSGRKLKVESSRQGRNRKWKIYIDNASDAVRTIHLHYRVTNGLRFLEDHDELYWDVTGEGWDYPLEDVSAEVFLPTGAGGI